MWCNCSCFCNAHERDLSATPRFSFCTRFFFCLSVMARLASAVFVFALSILCVSVSPAAALGFLSVQAAKMLGGSNASHTVLAGVEAVGYNHVMGTYTSNNYMCRAPTSNRDGLLLGTATSENPTTCQAVDGTGAATSLTSTVRAGCGSICACAACCARRRCLVCTRLVLCLMNLGLCGCHCHCSVGV